MEEIEEPYMQKRYHEKEVAGIQAVLLPLVSRPG